MSFWRTLVLGAGLAVVGCNDRAEYAVGGQHDFGIVDLDSEAIIRSHVFQITNASDQPLVVLEVKSTCGCTQADVSDLVIAPETSASLSASMQFTSSGRKSAEVRLLGEGAIGGVIVYELTGVGRMQAGLTRSRTRVNLDPGDAVDISILATTPNQTGVPGRVSADAGEGLIASTGSWRLIDPGDTAAGTPARWLCPLTIRAEATSSAGSPLRKVVVAGHGGKHISVHVRVNSL